MLASKAVVFKAPKAARSYAAKPAAPSASSTYTPPDISGLLSLKLKYGANPPPKNEHVNELKKYFESIGLKKHLKKVQDEKANDPYKLELERYKKTKPSEYNSQEKLEKLFPLIAKKNPWPTKEEARVKGAQIFGLKGNEKSTPVEPINIWEQWQRDKLALYDSIQEALDSTEDAYTEANLPFSSSVPQLRPLDPEDLALLPPDLRVLSVQKSSYPATTTPPAKSEPEENEARTYIAEYVSRQVEIVSGELYNSANPVNINPFEDPKK